MGSSTYIGRVGALAVALGIGTALTSGAGIAWADDGGSAGKSTANSKTDNAPTGRSDTSGTRSATKPDTGPRRGPLSALGEHFRHEVESNLDTVRQGVRRTEGRLQAPRETSRGERRTRTTQIRVTRDADANHEDATANTDMSPEAADSGRTGRSAQVDAAPATAAVPRQRQTPVATRVTIGADERTEPAVEAVPVRDQDAAVPVRRRAESPVVAVHQVDAPEATTARAAAHPVVSTLLSVAGFSPFDAGNRPEAPAPSPALWAMMAWARREFAQSISPDLTKLTSVTRAASVVAEDEIRPMAAATPNLATQTDDLTPKPTVPSSLTTKTTKLGWVTGPNSDTGHWYVAGTDLGIMWNSGYTDPDTGKAIIYTLFGDTYSGPGMTGDWRNNVLFRTADFDLSDGLQFSDAVINAGAQFPGDPNGTPEWYGSGGAPAGASQIIYDPGGLTGLFGTTYTMIPTSAIAIENEDGSFTQYATVMSIRTWDNPGSWTTNYAGIASSDDGGKTWTVDPDTVRSSGWLRAAARYVPGDEHFQQNALVMSNDPDDPYVYVYGTPSGRQGSAYVSRVRKDEITDLGAYQYFAGEDATGSGIWTTGDPSAAVPVFGSSETDLLPRLYKVADFFTLGLFSKIANGIVVGGLPTNGHVSEMSVQYNEYLGQYVVLYTDGGNDVVMRVSDTPQGTWSDTTTLVNNDLITDTGMYAPMVHPMSGTDYFNTVDADGNVVDNSHYLYYNLSYWGPYNVRLLQTDLESMKTITV